MEQKQNLNQQNPELEYNAIEGLTEAKWVQHRASNFIGTTQHPTHLFEEAFDNALDEAQAGFANKIDITFKNGICKVVDNGRGMPVDKDEKTGLPFPVLACTKLGTSGKFNLKVKAYKNSSGTHGIGITAVTFLSDFTVLRTHRNGKAYEYVFTTDFNTGIVNTLEKPVVESNEKGTIICFKPSSKIFKSTEFLYDYIKDRVKLCKMLIDADITLKIDDNIISIDGNRETLLGNFFEECIGKDTYYSECNNNGEILRVWFYYDLEKNDTKFKGSVNLLPVHTGTHLKYVKKIIPEVLENFMPKNKLTKNDMLLGLRCFVSAEIAERDFGSQTKGELVNDIEYFDKFTTLLKISLNKTINEQVDVQALYDKFIAYKTSLEIKQVTKKIKKRRYTSNLLDCSKYDNSTLFIVEGESAAGSLIKCRDRNKHAVYTLTGKSMPNVETNSGAKIMSNKTVLDLFNVLSKDNDLKPIDDTSKVRYDYISITTDPDVDGYHISRMMLLFFNRFFPKLIEEGRIILSQIPLYGYYDKKKFIGVYDLNEAKTMLANGKKLMRHKGLGEFDPDELEVILFHEARYIVVTKELIEELKGQENESSLSV